MMRRVRVRHVGVVVMVAAVLATLTYVLLDAGLFRETRQMPARTLKVAHITEQDIVKVGRREVVPSAQQPGVVTTTSEQPTQPPLVPHPRSSLQADVPSPQQAPLRSDARTEGNLHYDSADDILPANSHVTTVHEHKSNRTMVTTNYYSTIQNAAKNNLVSRNEDILDMSQFTSIPIDKRKKLERFISHLSQDQFNEMFKYVIGYADIQKEAKSKSLSHSGQTKNKLHSDKLFPPSMQGRRGRSFNKFGSSRGSSRVYTGRGSTNVTSQGDGAGVTCIHGCRSPGRLHDQVRGYAARVAVESITLPPQWTTPPLVAQRLRDRRKHVKEVCHKHGLDIPSEDNTVNAWEFLVSQRHHLVWCNVFKAASSTWFYNFNILAGYSEQRLLSAKETPITLARRKYPRPSVAELQLLMNATDRPLSFMIARHPLQRLVSGFRDKLLSGRRYYSNVARRIVMSYPELGTKDKIGDAVHVSQAVGNMAKELLETVIKRTKAHRRIVVPTFPQFVQFIIDSHKKGEKLDEHWAPMYSFCSPCLFDFDVLAKMETLDEDGNYIIFESGIQHIIKPKRINRNRSAPTDEVAASFLCQLSRPQLLGLLDLYKYDLELFQYDYQQYLDCTADQTSATPPPVPPPPLPPV